MFTGIIKELGKVKTIDPNNDGATITIESPETLKNASIGDSIAVNGTCLTITAIIDNCWTADIVTETMNCTCLGDLKAGDKVNLERPVTAACAMDGHFVQGHVDGTGTITDKTPLPDGSTSVTISCPNPLMKYIVNKGSIAVDGTSLTVAKTANDTFSFAMIPHTEQLTTLGLKSPGEKVNLEVDILAKYVEKLMHK